MFNRNEKLKKKLFTKRSRSVVGAAAAVFKLHG
jgi:hypothetical protein